jgi:hypothetical protein
MAQNDIAKALGIDLYDYMLDGVEIPDQFKKEYFDKAKKTVGTFDYGDLQYAELLKAVQSGNPQAIATYTKLQKERGYTPQTKPSLAMGESFGLMAGNPGKEATENEKKTFMERYMGQSAENRIRQETIDAAKKFYADQYAKTKAGKNKKTNTKRTNTKKTMGGEEQRDYESRIRKSTDPEDYRQDKFKPKVEEKFVPRDTVLGRIFDERVREGEEISNRDKAFALLRNIGDNLSERRLVGGKEGTDTFSRIFGKSGGLREGMDEIEALEDEAIALREKGETKAAAAIDKILDRQKTAYEIKKIDSEAMKNIAEAAKSDYSKATQQAMELATIRGFEPGSPDFMAEVDAILSVAVTEGQAAIIKDLADLQSQLSIMDPDSEEAKAMQDRISMLQRKSVGTTMDTDAYKLPEMTINPDGSLKTS